MANTPAAPAAEQTILRERLALDRTTLANERTFLAYVRTALTLLVVGFSFIELPVFRSPWFAVQGWIFVPFGLLTLIIGVWRFRSVRKDIHRLGQPWIA